MAAAVAGAALLAPALAAENPESAVELEPMQVTATKDPEAVDKIPASVTVVTGAELRARGASDLRTALALVGGVEGTPGGDAGPAGAVPAVWGLREADAYLLVIDGVPWGGAFNPATPSIDLAGVERIEILRGAAPVMYGATSFVGVIHVIHYAPGEMPSSASLGGGSYGSFGASATTNLGAGQSLVAEATKTGFKTDREDVKRYRVLYRGGVAGFHVDADLSRVPQTPGDVLVIDNTTGRIRGDIPMDKNQNPSDARLDQQRFHLAAGYDAETGLGQWATTVAVTRTLDDIIRGFLRGNAPDVSGAGSPDGNDADGFTQTRQITDVYFDTHLSQRLARTVRLTTGLDYLYGRGHQHADNFAYFVSLDGHDAPPSGASPVDEIAVSTNTRHFAGVYTQADWQAVPDALDVLAGLRVNRTRETAWGEAIDIAGAGAGNAAATESLTKTRLSGVLGASWHAWKSGKDGLTVYADYRNTYKPLATDFGPEAEVDVLQPETAQSYELGAKTQLFDGALDMDASVFLMDFNNGLTFDSAGAPANGGRQRFQGAELEARYRIVDDLMVAASYAYHDSRFREFTTDGGTNVAGNRVEMAPYHLGALGVLYAPFTGFNASVVSNLVGQRMLDPENTLRTGSYATLDASAGYRWDRFGIQLAGTNLTDRRPPVAQSELQEVATNHDPAFPIQASGAYRLPAIAVMLNLSASF